MTNSPIVLIVSLALLASPALEPIAAPAAERFHGGAVGGRAVVSGQRIASHPIGAHGSFRHPFVPRPHPGRFFPHRHHRFVPFGFGGAVFVAPPIWYGSPAYYAPPAYYNPPPAYYNPQPVYYNPQPAYDSPAVYSPPAAYSPPARGAISIAPAPTPQPNVVEYPTGRYELRGDGLTTPYTWVWIPNPPPPPPPPPALPPAGPPASGTPAPRQSQLYHWTDEQGVMHLTDRWDAVPPEYRAQPKQAHPS